HGKVLALVAPTCARAIRDCPTHEETAELTKGTVLGNDYPADKARLLKSGILDRRNIRPASSKGVMVIVEGDDEMLVPVVRLRDRWYFARDKVVFPKHGPQME
ncbi:MAG: hypothetical protein QGD94_09180, partial [Planctomycetia bacterium]|nr:hypothetical protein [Planctomycetia bacterium]